MKEHTNIRLETKLKKDLTKEAKDQHRSFTNYIEMLLSTHQDRKAIRASNSGQRLR